MTETITPAAGPTIKEQGGALLAHAAGNASHKTIAIGLRSGLLAELGRALAGATPDELAERLGLDPFYVSVWCRATLAAGVCDRDGDGYLLAPHVANLLLDTRSPASVGGVFGVLEQPEMFARFEANLASGERLWWDGCGPDWIAGVARTGTPFSTRLIPGGLEQVPGLAERLAAGGLIVDSACGAGVGLLRLAAHYPACRVLGVDGDGHSIERVAGNVLAALEPGGWFVISGPARAWYDDLLSCHGFTDLGSATSPSGSATLPSGGPNRAPGR